MPQEGSFAAAAVNESRDSSYPNEWRNARPRMKSARVASEQEIGKLTLPRLSPGPWWCAWDSWAALSADAERQRRREREAAGIFIRPPKCIRPEHPPVRTVEG